MSALQGTCPVCACGFSEGDLVTICERCEQPHHTDCYEYAGGCAIFGCIKSATPPKRDVSELSDLERDEFIGSLLGWARLVRMDGNAYIARGYAVLFTFVCVITSFLALSIGYESSSRWWSGGAALMLAAPFIFATSIGFCAVCVTTIVKFIISVRRWMYEVSYVDVNLVPPSLSSATAAAEMERLQVPDAHFFYGNLACEFIKGFDVHFKVILTVTLGIRLALDFPIYLSGTTPQIVGSIFLFFSFMIPVKLFSMLLRPFSLMIKEHFNREALLVSSFENRLAASIKKG